MLNNHDAYKYETPYESPFVIKRCCTNGTVTLQYSPTKIRYNIHRIKPYKYDTNIEYINPKNMYDDANIWLPVIYFRLTLNLINKLYNWMSTETLMLSYLGRASAFFNEKVILFTWYSPKGNWNRRHT